MECYIQELSIEQNPKNRYDTSNMTNSSCRLKQKDTNSRNSMETNRKRRGSWWVGLTIGLEIGELYTL